MLIIGFSHSESETVTFNATLRAAGYRVKSCSLHTLWKIIQTRGIYPISKFLSNSFPCNSNKLERIV